MNSRSHATDDEARQEAYDAGMHECFDALGKMAVPDSEKALYPAQTFARRERFLKHLIADLATRLGSRTGDPPTCLDIGCNTGRYTRLLADAGLQARGVDYSSNLVDEARALHPTLQFDQANVYALPFADGAFDAVVSFGVLQCLADWRTTLREIVRVLRPGGLGVIETNRGYSVLENSLRCASYVLRGKMDLRKARAFFQAHARSASHRIDRTYPIRFYAAGAIMSALRDDGVIDMVWHDPRRLPFYHDFESWGLMITKPSPNESAAGRPKPAICRTCRRSRTI